MGIEEAVETVLREQPWLECGICAGGSDYLYCPTCDNKHWVKNALFEQACHVLGRDFPDPPPVMPSRPDRLIFPSFELQNMTAFQDVPYNIPISKILEENSMKDTGLEWPVIIDEEKKP